MTTNQLSVASRAGVLKARAEVRSITDRQLRGMIDGMRSVRQPDWSVDSVCCTARFVAIMRAELARRTARVA